MSVSVVKCPDYEAEAVYNALQASIDLLGGIEAFARSGETIFLKLNLIMPLAPEIAATTHPAVVRAMCKLLANTGAKVVVGDCPGYPLTEPFLRAVYRTTGIERAVEGTGAVLNYDTETTTLHNLPGRILKSLDVARAMAEADGIINMPKLKTHGLTVMTGAVKNMFGVIPGLKKAEFHAKMPKVADFCRLLVDIAAVVAPRLSVMDAVTCMEGAGPTHGEPVHAGFIMASESVFDLDVVGAWLAGIEPRSVPTIAEALSLGLGTPDLHAVRVLGDLDALKSFGRPFVPAVIRSSSNPLQKYMPEWLASRFLELVRPYPAFDPNICTGCATCRRQCPPGAITMVDGLPLLDRNKCIRCFCCQELCPHGAVTMQKPWLARLIMR